jgi:oligopeptide/dipeptide ABC transporter ATP-binding protein
MLGFERSANATGSTVRLRRAAELLADGIDLRDALCDHENAPSHYADRIAVMYLGRIIEQGPTHEIVHNPQHPYTRALLSVVPKPDPRQRSKPQILQGESPNSVRIPPGCRFHPRCPMAIPDCKEVDPELRRPAAATSPEHLAACIRV